MKELFTNILAEIENKKTFGFAFILFAGAMLSVCIQIFPMQAASYVLCPWVFLPCFLYVSRNASRKRDYLLWLFFWCGSFMARYLGILEPFSVQASVLLTLLASFVYLLPFLIDRLTYKCEQPLVTYLGFPFFCASLDYFMELTNLGSLFSISLTQFDNKPLLQMVSILGNKGLVFVLAFWASTVTNRHNNRRRMMCCLGAIAILHICGFARMMYHSSDIESADIITIGWSAEPIVDDSFFYEGTDGSWEANVLSLTGALEEAKKSGVELLCFPEESFYLYREDHDTFIKQAQVLAEKYRMNLLLSVESDNSDVGNSASGSDVGINHSIFIDKNGIILADYYKTKLIPVAEAPYYVAGDGILPEVSIRIGETALNLSYAICFDGDFASYIRTISDNINLFIDVSWDWDQVKELHYRIIGMRAVENGMTVVKPTIDGYTTATDYLGKIQSKTHSDDTGYQGVKKVEMPIVTTETIYHRFGHIVDNLYVFGFIIMMILAMVGKGEKMEKKQPLVRFGEFELLKALAILGLPLVHVMEEAMEANMASPSLIKFGSAVIGLCVFGPSIFMICMGFGIGGGTTRASSIRKTGIQFLIIGALLNIVRWLIPGIISAVTIHTRLLSDIDYCLQSDIYYFVGLFFILYSFLKQINASSTQLLLASIIMLTVNNLMTPLVQKYVTNEIAGALLGNIIYVDETSCFPLLSWAIFPTVGIIIGEVLKSKDEEFREVFMRRLMDCSIIFLGAFLFFLWNYEIDIVKVVVSPINDYITDLPNVIILISLACFVIGVFYYLCKIIGNTRFMAFMLKISTLIIPFYLLQWVIISWIFYGTEIFGAPKESFGLVAYFATVAVVTGICIFVTLNYGMKIMKVLLRYTSLKRRRRKKPVKKNENAE